ncbi:MAG TPA: UDP-N-acetylmuramate--L-alanine ligase [Acidimicrobiales bacterium]|nr:UDP-N-acetylmuramate--L-alanine ligase [Acidimicrobiales bacterium]
MSTSQTTALDLGRPRRIHLVGIGGAGMSAIATVLAAMGHRVTGSDLKASPIVDRLRPSGVEVAIGHDAANLGDAEVVGISTAIPPSNPEVSEAGRRGIPVLSRADVLSAICAERRTIAVAGTHGKTTTSSMLTLILMEAGLRPSFVIGGELNETGTGASWTDGEWFVVEADESDGTFLRLPAEVAVVTSVEPDHLEHYGSFDALIEAFADFLGRAATRIAFADGAVSADVARRSGATTFGAAAGADYRMVDPRGERMGYRFGLVRGDQTVDIDLAVPGAHNALNAAAAAVTALELGIAADVVARALSRFTGVARRFTFRGEAGGITFVDDYAHLPGEVVPVLEAASSGGWGRVVCVFQPHRYSRTAALWRDFAHSFDRADLLVVTDVYGSGEAPRPGVSGKLIVDAVSEANPGKRVVYLPGRESLVAFLRSELRSGDVCLTLGAGDLTSLPDELLGAMA